MKTLLEIRRRPNFVTLILSVFLSSLIHAQKVDLNRTFIESPEIQRYDRLTNNLMNIYKFNKLKEQLGQMDTIIVHKLDNDYTALYDNHLFEIGSKRIYEEGKLTIWGNSSFEYMFFFCETCSTDSTCTRMTVANGKGYLNDPLVKITNYLDESMHGDYVEQTMSGKEIVFGQFQLRDSMFQDTIRIVDPETYETSIEVKKRNHIGVKCGKWIRKNINGEIVEIHEEENCK